MGVKRMFNPTNLERHGRTRLLHGGRTFHETDLIVNEKGIELISGTCNIIENFSSIACIFVIEYPRKGS